jgi:RNA methyltransferase, TrmH family
MIISSLSNPRIKSLRKLRNRKERQSSGLFLIEGLRIVTEAAQQSAHFESLVVCPELLVSSMGKKLAGELSRSGVDVVEVTQEVFESFSAKDGPQGIAAVIHQQIETMEHVKLEKNDLWIALDAVQDPGNLGTILRTGDAVGAKGVILLDHSTDPFDPTAIRASMGSIFSQKLVIAEWKQFFDWESCSGVSLVGTSGAARQDYNQFVYPMPLILLMGSERQGLQEHHLRACDAVVSIPMVGRSDSLNLSVATGVVLYAIFNQRRNVS